MWWVMLAMHVLLFAINLGFAVSLGTWLNFFAAVGNGAGIILSLYMLNKGY